MDTTGVRVENLREALRQVQQFVVVGLAASFSLLFLQLSTKSGEIQLPWPVVPVDLTTAKVLLGVAHIAAGFIAIGNVEVAKRSAKLITDAPLRNAVLGYPSFTTHSEPILRVVTCFAPPVCFTIAVVIWMASNNFEKDKVDMAIFFLIFGVLPYLGVFFLTRELIPTRDRDAAPPEQV